MRRVILFCPALVAAVALAVACGADEPILTSVPAATPTPTPFVTASLLIEPNADDARWLRDIVVPKGTDGYELLEAATSGELVSEWFPQFRAHFVSEILGIAPEGDAFWSVFVWNEGTPGWEPLPVGADLFSVKEGHIMGWALVEFDPDSAQLPTSLP